MVTAHRSRSLSRTVRIHISPGRLKINARQHLHAHHECTSDVPPLPEDPEHHTPLVRHFLTTSTRTDCTRREGTSTPRLQIRKALVRPFRLYHDPAIPPRIDEPRAMIGARSYVGHGRYADGLVGGRWGDRECRAVNPADDHVVASLRSVKVTMRSSYRGQRSKMTGVRLGSRPVLQQLQVLRNLLAPRRDVDMADRVAASLRTDDAVEVRRRERECRQVLWKVANT